MPKKQNDDTAGGGPNAKATKGAITMSQINSDRLTLVCGPRGITSHSDKYINFINPSITQPFAFLTIFYQLANDYWSPNTSGAHLQYEPAIVEDIYYKEIRKSEFATRRIVMLEFSQYLEQYLWPNYARATASHAHMMSVVVMLNEKFRERVDAWVTFKANDAEFPNFFQQVLEACLEPKQLTGWYLSEQTARVRFLNHCFNSMEVELCREQVKRLVSLSIWSCLQPSE